MIGGVNLKRWKRVLATFLSIVGILIILASSMMYFLYIAFSSPFEKLGEEDFGKFASIGQQLFLLCDEEYIIVGDKIEANKYNSKPKIGKVLSKYKRKIVSVHLVDKDVMLLSFGAILHSVEGIAIRRNNAELKKAYENTGFDGESLNYTELVPNVYRFSAGV